MASLVIESDEKTVNCAERALEADCSHPADGCNNFASDLVLRNRYTVELIAQYLNSCEILRFSEVSVLFREVTE